MTINNRFSIGDFVYLKTDTDQLKRIIVGIKITPGSLVYFLEQGLDSSEHYEFELSEEKDQCIILGIDQDAINN